MLNIISFDNNININFVKDVDIEYSRVENNQFTASDVGALPDTTIIPVVPEHKTLNTTNTTAQTVNASESLNGNGSINLHKVSKTGNYNDLLDKPTIPTDTGATSIETTGSGNAVTSASYNSSTRKITLSKGSTFLTSHQAIKTLKTDNTTSQTASSTQKDKARTLRDEIKEKIIELVEKFTW